MLYSEHPRLMYHADLKVIIDVLRRVGTDLLERLGYTIQAMSQASGVSRGQQTTLMLFSRHDNAWYLSGRAAQPVGSVRLRFPEGASLFNATFTRLKGGASHYPLVRAMRHECRVFVQQDHGVVGCDPAPRDPYHRELTPSVSELQDYGHGFANETRIP